MCCCYFTMATAGFSFKKQILRIFWYFMDHHAAKWLMFLHFFSLTSSSISKLYKKNQFWFFLVIFRGCLDLEINRPQSTDIGRFYSSVDFRELFKNFFLDFFFLKTHFLHSRRLGGMIKMKKSQRKKSNCLSITLSGSLKSVVRSFS